MEKVVNIDLLQANTGVLAQLDEHILAPYDTIITYEHPPYQLLRRHVYFTAREACRIGEKYLSRQGNVVQTCQAIDYLVADKILACSDPTLGLPILPPSFLEEYRLSNGAMKQTVILCTDSGNCEINGYVVIKHLVNLPDNGLLR